LELLEETGLAARVLSVGVQQPCFTDEDKAAAWISPTAPT
jgi:hypothetical protein